MKRTNKILIFFTALILAIIIPFCAQAKSGQFQLSKNQKRIEYVYSNGKKAGNTTVKSQGKKYTVVKGNVKLINGKKSGRVTAIDGKSYYLVNGKTFSGIFNKKYFTNGLRDKTKTGIYKYQGKKYYFYKGKYANGITNNRYYKNGKTDKTKNGMIIYKGIKYYIKKGVLFTGLYKKRYYLHGVVNKAFTGYKTFGKKKYYIYKGKLANGLHGNKYYKDGKTDKTVKGYKTINGFKYYFIKGVLADPTIDHPLKILMVGNSYTFYNGYPQMLSKMIASTKKSAVIVRATKGSRSLPQLMSETINYVAWKDGENIGSGSGKYLKDIINIDFGDLKRAGKWDYIIGQNNEEDYTKLYSGDVKFFNFAKDYVKSSKRVIIHGMYYSTTVNSTRYNEHMKCVEKCNCSIINSVSYYSSYKTYFNTNYPIETDNPNDPDYKDRVKNRWKYELTLRDSDHHPSGRGGYLLSLCIYAKLFGVNSFARNESDSKFIKVYNSDGGYTKEFAPDYFKKKEAPDFAMSVDKREAKILQAYVRAYADEYLGAPLYKQNYNLT